MLCKLPRSLLASPMSSSVSLYLDVMVVTPVAVISAFIITDPPSRRKEKIRSHIPSGNFLNRHVENITEFITEA